MNKKNVYFIQPNNLLSDSIYLPYSIGTIAAYCFQFEHIKQHYNLCDFIFIKEQQEAVIEKIDSPFIIGFSNYMWNVDYNIELAKAVKEKWPESIIVFGGPQIPDNTDYLEKYDFIDFLIHGEGETVFYDLLNTLKDNAPTNNVSNISYRKNGYTYQSQKTPPGDLTLFPSPYVSGYFDKIIKDSRFASIQFDAIIETNRGCPYGCIYCYWARSGSVFRQFPMERVKKDLEWMAKNKITYCFCADSNFGVLDRDESIAEYVVKLKKKYGYPSRFETTSAKNKDDLVFRINRKLNDSGLIRGVALAVQSMTPEVLKIIGRSNMSTENFSSQISRYKQSSMHTYTDMILGLPGETLESFCRSLFSVIEAGQHSSITVYRCEMLPNTIMYADSFREKYKIKTISSILCQNHSHISDGLDMGSRSEIVVETSTMSMQEWAKAFRISVCTQSFHGMGLLRFLAVYLRKAKGISYYDFYLDLYNWIEEKSTVIKSLLNHVCRTLDPFLNGESSLFFIDERFGNIYYDFDEGLFLCCAANLDSFYEEIEAYVRKYFDDTELFEDLFEFQRSLIALPSQKENILTTDYDWEEFFRNDLLTTPCKIKTTVKVTATESPTWEDYAREIVWYGKRKEKTLSSVTRIIEAK